ncbi:hypothetical protein ACLM44_07975 [Synechococcus sp. W2B2]|uniref:hypothetical protein n=1 Tax=unclassified Synechococcus TaxID=2626047 RepID=UPI00006B3E74|nr:hypothetical protein [Synechococcus sp. WH 7805]EAR19351.1 hypothetical protein WH7805_08336 [Synechococcus sp. WH 7805]
MATERDAQEQDKEKSQRQLIKLKQNLEVKEERLQKLATKRDALVKEKNENRSSEQRSKSNWKPKKLSCIRCLATFMHEIR